ncbi:capsule assembly Wzi family protein [Phorcysia thermohydrogeniphila]|uniref:Capsule assembly protein Wzi n=1 Tax=Phorcysia thermohydrogeniphila TaxID=936138 RepID=A0A4R1GD36_9BACT|nr:capsule assembly Wzi family protein [Phorcysia thermohydrogeniphila]TCK04465.1 capsule assembly protein Wzi [Phorcysia thermohydrogeniphila]
MKLKAVTIAVLLIAGLLPTGSLAKPISSLVSPYQYQREYRLLERAKEVGLVKKTDLSFKPLSRTDFARAIIEIYNNRNVAPDLARKIFNELYPEFKEDINSLFLPGKGRNYIKPIRNVYTELYTLSGSDNRRLPYSEGFNLEEGINFRMNVSSELRYSGILFFLEPELRQDTPRFNRAYVAWNFKGLNFLFGRENVIWGNAENGDLIFTNNVRPWLMFKLENDSYKKLPWIFEKLGEYRFSTFVSELEKERERSYAHVWGMRLAWRPFYNLEVAGTRAIQFGGEGRPDYTSLHDFWELFTANNENVKDPRPEAHVYDNNQYASIDITYYADWLSKLQFQPFKGGKVYFVHAGDDAVKPGPGGFPLPTSAAHIFGISLTTGLTDLRFEYTETTDDSGVWYTHHMYPDGFTYHDFIIGNAIGGNSKSLYYAISHDFNWGNLNFSYNFVKHEVRDKLYNEKEYIYSFEINKCLDFGGFYKLRIHSSVFYFRLTYNRVENFHFLPEDKDIYILSTGVNLSF